MKTKKGIHMELRVGSIYKAKDDTNYIIIKKVTKTDVEFINVDYRFKFCEIFTHNPIEEVIEELKDFELINYEL